MTGFLVALMVGKFSTGPNNERCLYTCLHLNVDLFCRYLFVFGDRDLGTRSLLSVV